MSQIQYVDELIREYLLYRGFSGTLKTFDAELKVDREKGFRVDKIVDQLLQYIYTHDLPGLRDLWGHLDQKMFSKVENEFSPAIRKLESSVLKLYLVNAVTNNKPDKVTEFFSRLTPDLQGQSEWKDWFMLPYVKNPEESSTFSVYFTRSWQDTLLVSLHNFLALIYQAMPVPVLASYEEEAARVRRLTEENDSLRLKLVTLQQRSSLIPEVLPPLEIMDDFYIIAQEIPAGMEVQGKSLKSLIRTIGGGTTSPIMGRKPHDGSHKRTSSKQRLSSTPTGTGVWGRPSDGGAVAKRSVSLETRSRSRNSPREASLDRTGRQSRQEFLLLSQEETTQHNATVTQCLFTTSGTVIASSDTDGLVKIWSAAPQPKLLSSHCFKSGVLCLDWVSKNERYLVCGTRTGVAALFDSKESKPLWEITVEEKAKVVNVACSPTESVFVSASVNPQNQGKLVLYDIKTKKLEATLSLGPGPQSLYATCCAYNHNGQLLVAGCSDGTVRTIDLRHSEVIDSWSGHQGAVAALQLTPDQNYCYSLGHDNKLYRHSFNQTKQPVWETVLPFNTSCFTLDHSGNHVLLCGQQGASIHQVVASGTMSLLKLTSMPTVACHWANANQFATCVTAGSDGRMKIHTLLTP